VRWVRVLVLICLGLWLRERHAEWRIEEATAFIDALVPRLRAFKRENGRYPETIPAEWYDGQPLPWALRPDFYLRSADEQEFLMRFRDPRSDPRFWFIDIIAFQSDIGHWDRWDGY
jgi:hypothetical protein